MGNFLFIRKMCFLWLPLFAGFGFCLSAVLLNGRIRGVGVVSDEWPFIKIFSTICQDACDKASLLFISWRSLC